MKYAWSRSERRRRRQQWLEIKSKKDAHVGSKIPKGASSSPNHQRAIYIEYYQGAFAWLHGLLFKKHTHGIDAGIRMRRDFWHLIPDDVYRSTKATELVSLYLNAVERRLADTLRTHSVNYWLHVYRRLAPASAGPNETPTTIMLVRQRLEAAIQKYATADDDPSLAWTDKVKTDEVLAGVPDHLRQPKLIRAMLRGPQDQVLTKFAVADLLQLYECEQLAYEVWRCGATARIISKGSDLVVDHTSRQCFFDNRSEDLNTLVTNYDNRQNPFIASATATVFDNSADRVNGGGKILLAQYNVEGNAAGIYAPLFAPAGVSLGDGMKFNFDWIPFDIKGYVSAHKFLSEPFHRKHGFRFEVALIVLIALCYRKLEVWLNTPPFMYQGFQRAYSGPSLVSNVLRIVQEGADVCARILEVEQPTTEELESAIRFLTLTEDKKGLISLSTGGPTFLFIPSGEDRVIVDFAWVTASLQYLFLGVPLTEKGAKGRLLEALVAGGESDLPTSPCKGDDGTSKQVDAAFKRGRALIIVECKANAKSIAYERGDLPALQFRRKAFEEALRQVDDKAVWLSKHPRGRNYDISDVEAILPVVITPFKEFMPSLENRYWVKSEVPRVLIPSEFKDLLADGNLESVVRSNGSTVFIGKQIGTIDPR